MTAKNVSVNFGNFNSMTFKDYIELINWVNDLAIELNSRGENTMAEKLDFALRTGGTPNELLGAIRLALLHFNKTKIPRRMKIKQKVSAALKMLDKDLGPRPKL